MKHFALLAGALTLLSIHTFAQSSSDSGKSTVKPSEAENDPALTKEELELVSRLSPAQVAQIDQEILANCSTHWRKVAMVVGTTMLQLKNRAVGIPDTYYAQRVAKLVGEGKLEAQGNLQRMRFSEVRITLR